MKEKKGIRFRRSLPDFLFYFILPVEKPCLLVY